MSSCSVWSGSSSVFGESACCSAKLKSSRFSKSAFIDAADDVADLLPGRLRALLDGDEVEAAAAAAAARPRRFHEGEEAAAPLPPLSSSHLRHWNLDAQDRRLELPIEVRADRRPSQRADGPRTHYRR